MYIKLTKQKKKRALAKRVNYLNYSQDFAGMFSEIDWLKYTFWNTYHTQVHHGVLIKSKKKKKIQRNIISNKVKSLFS